MDSILNSVKEKLSGILPEYKVFDSQIIDYINGAFAILNQLGVGPDEPFMIEDETTTWEDFDPTGRFALIKMYIPIKVKLLFDPPSNGFLVDELNKQASEYEFRLQCEAERTLLYDISMDGIYKTEEE